MEPDWSKLLFSGNKPKQIKQRCEVCNQEKNKSKMHKEKVAKGGFFGGRKLTVCKDCFKKFK